jgi:hypothetical protein
MENKSTKQKYRDEWELLPQFSKWLTQEKNDDSGHYAYCKICRCEMQARLATIKIHGKSTKHVSLMNSSSGSSKVHCDWCFTLSIIIEI